jgi:hypothetical protein
VVQAVVQVLVRDQDQEQVVEVEAEAEVDLGLLVLLLLTMVNVVVLVGQDQQLVKVPTLASTRILTTRSVCRSYTDHHYGSSRGGSLEDGEFCSKHLCKQISCSLFIHLLLPVTELSFSHSI